jgi:hypothetical protein
MREAPDVILIGEILDADHHGGRDRLRRNRPPVPGHAALQQRRPDLERILNFFPESAHKNVLMNLALNLRRSSRSAWWGKDGRRLPATEVLINTPMIRDLIRRGQVHEIKEAMDSSRWRKACRPSTSAVPDVQGRPHRAGGSAAQGRFARRPGPQDPPVRRRRAASTTPTPTCTHSSRSG